MYCAHTFVIWGSQQPHDDQLYSSRQCRLNAGSYNAMRCLQPERQPVKRIHHLNNTWIMYPFSKKYHLFILGRWAKDLKVCIWCFSCVTDLVIHIKPGVYHSKLQLKLWVTDSNFGSLKLHNWNNKFYWSFWLECTGLLSVSQWSFSPVLPVLNYYKAHSASSVPTYMSSWHLFQVAIYRNHKIWWSH